MESPKIQLLRAGDGTWNYSKIGSNQAAGQMHGDEAGVSEPNRG